MNRGQWRRIVPEAVIWTLDLLVVGIVSLATLAAAFIPALNGTPVQLFLGLVFVFFSPGYAFVAALFPWNVGAGRPVRATLTERTGDVPETKGLLPTRPSVSLLERVAISVGMSFAVVPLLVLVLNFTPWGIQVTTVLVSIAGFVLLSLLVAAIRRLALPAEDRFVVPARPWSESALSGFGSSGTRTDTLLSVVLVVTVVAMVITVGGALASEDSGEQFTEFYLLTEKENGELTADEYPTTLRRGEKVPLVVGVTNQERQLQSYTVVIAFQRVDLGNNTTDVIDQREVDRFSTQLAHNETWEHRHEVTPSMNGEEIRLVYLLYKGEPPEVTSMETAYRKVHLWVTVRPR